MSKSTPQVDLNEPSGVLSGTLNMVILVEIRAREEHNLHVQDFDLSLIVRRDSRHVFLEAERKLSNLSKCWILSLFCRPRFFFLVA